jgi:2-oxoglutarate ferredoxin oxidoreductase subunit beta
MIAKALNHKGFGLVNILQPCVTFNKINTYAYYMTHAYKLGSDYDPKNKQAAIAKALELHEEKFALGVLYEEHRAAYHEELPQLQDGTLVSGGSRSIMLSLCRISFNKDKLVERLLASGFLQECKLKTI